MTNGQPQTGTLGPARLPFGLPQNLGGAYPWLLAVADDNTASVTVTANQIDGYSTIIIYRIVGSTRVPIREANDVQTGGAAQGVFEDFEAPLGVSFYYILNADDEDVATSNVVSLSVDDNTFWLKDPSDSSLNIQVKVSSMGRVSRPGNVLAETRVLGRKNKHTVNDVRSGREGSMVLMAEDLDEQTALISIFADGGVLLFQCSPDFGFEDLYFATRNLDEEWQGRAQELTHLWSLDFIEQDAPASSTNVNSLNSYLQVTLFGTYQNLLNKRDLYTNVLTTPWSEVDGTG